jgi:NTE family protein
MPFLARNRARMVPVLLLCFVSSFMNLTASAQEAAPARPKVALVLSGGGARGFAHIGVIEWLEEHRIPVDIVTGTSMGGLIAGMYATGMTPAEAHQFITAVDWDKSLLAEPNYDQLSFRRKEDRRAYQLGVALGLKNGLSGPTGFNPGHGVALLFDRAAYGYSGMKTFDDMPIPFRCVATDLVTGDPEVLQDGSLPMALRATMAVPGVFTPVELNDKILVDGGMVDNIPTDVARDMGAKIIIVVDVASELGSRKELSTLGGVIDQALDIATLENERRGLKLANVVVKPELRKFSASDFYSSELLIHAGYEAAAKSMADLLPYALPEDQWQRHLHDRYARKRTVPSQISKVEVAGVGSRQTEDLQEEFGKFAGKPLDLRRLETELTRATGSGRFDLLGYETFPTPEGTGLRIDAHEKTYGPPFLDLAVNVQGSGTGDFDFSAGARLTMLDVGGRGGELRYDVVLGGTNFLSTELYQPLGSSRFFIAPRALFVKQSRGSFEGNHQIAEYHDRRMGAGLDVGFASGRRSEVRVGYEYFNGALATVIGSPQLPGTSGGNGLLSAKFVYEGQDSPNIPSRGARFSAEIDHIIHSPGAAHSFQQLKLNGSQFLPVSAKGSIFGSAAFGTSFSDTAGFFQKFSLGGPFRLGAYSRDQFLDSNFAYASVGYRYELFRLPVLVGRKVYAVAAFESGTTFPDFFDHVGVHNSINLGTLVETILGPVQLAGSVSTTGRTKVNFSIGRLF